MKQISVKDIIKICDGTLICGEENLICENFSKDTRTIQNGDVYVGIKGENFDGNKLYKEAFNKGAKVCLIEGEEIKKEEGKTIIVVKDTVKAIQKLAEYKRSLYSIPIIAVTGSVGKTSTKDIIASVMGKKYNVLKTEGNMNNHIGLPFTILKLKKHNAMVIEMGMNHFGEISTLTNIAKPTTCAITNIGTSHIGNLGSRENILKAKLEILEGMNKEEGTIILNNDNDLLHKWMIENTKKYNILSYGIKEKSDIIVENIKMQENKSTFDFNWEGNNWKVEVPVAGEHFIMNSLAAILIGIKNKIDMKDILDGIKEFSLSKRRMEIEINKKGTVIINDSYNASLDSMKAAIEILANRKENRKVAVLGDMFELGEYAENLHKEVGKEVASHKINLLVTVGDLSKNIVAEAIKEGMKLENVYHFSNNEEAISFLEKELQKGDVVLVKASNGMKFNKIVEKLIN